MTWLACGCPLPLISCCSEVAKKMVEAYQFAEADAFRATTHNKGGASADLMLHSISIGCRLPLQAS
jgi:hypothetical protein